MSDSNTETRMWEDGAKPNWIRAVPLLPPNTSPHVDINTLIERYAHWNNGAPARDAFFMCLLGTNMVSRTFNVPIISGMIHYESFCKKFHPIGSEVYYDHSTGLLKNHAMMYRINGQSILYVTDTDRFHSEKVHDPVDHMHDTDRDGDLYISQFVIYSTTGHIEQSFATIKPYIRYKKAIPKSDKYEIGLIVDTPQGLTVHNQSIKNRYTVNIEKHYNDDFAIFDTHMQHSIMNENGGLYLLHGEPGTGKTSYIKYLSSIMSEKKTFIFVPSQFVQSLGSPGFITVMLDNPDSVLIIEEAENVIKARGTTGNDGAVSNILNITDGILGDIIRCHVICTVNCDIAKIDPALQRSGRNRGTYEFKALSAKKAIALGADGEAKLCDIFNAPVDETGPKQRAIGFGSKQTKS